MVFHSALYELILVYIFVLSAWMLYDDLSEFNNDSEASGAAGRRSRRRLFGDEHEFILFFFLFVL